MKPFTKKEFQERFGQVVNKSFYHFLMSYRDPSPKSEIGHFANSAYDDHLFPRQSTSYSELTNYLELNAPYLSSMSIFDEAWEYYETYRSQR
ncbi:YozE family protein [Mangrovibacillus cuniculi]|uniref:UPF0346 protein G8O30_06365 n=1 Tax=Mangrovibacillus cuniculi TaxID=2593652 RepID=A0A7S8HFK4_9BACI|nr:YozE family protein [Mangrovibacillus cuniculi]QPC46611.1 YozE family protein [Mangrovibacillus cuniculi]